MRLLYLYVLGVFAAKPCPTPQGLTSTSADNPMSVTFENQSDEDLVLYWVDYQGNEITLNLLNAKSSETPGTFETHVFLARSLSGVVAMEHKVQKGDKTVVIGNCDELHAKIWNTEREQEFLSLVHPHDKPCEGPSSQWSCLREVTPALEAARKPQDYGFSRVESRANRRVGQDKDDSYVSHIPKIPVLTAGPGFLKMSMTTKLRNALLGLWSRETRSIAAHEPIDGDYTNIHVAPMDKLDLDRFPTVRQEAVQELQQIEQWWTRRKLKHTSTFGIRVYKRNAMLINHVDRADTHLASAVLQVAQEVDPEGGWPLEVLSQGKKYEVYLQPGELVLYEGARLFHGRPMRFNGTSFANVFSHFSPLDWKGPNKAKGYFYSEPVPTLYTPHFPSPDKLRDEL